MTQLILENRHKKALVRLELINKDTKEVERELGFATKIYIPEKEDVVLITSPSIFPDNIDTCLDDIAIHRWMPKPKQRNPPKVKNIENHKQADVCTVVFEGDDKKYSLPYEVLTEEKIKQHKILTACVFDGKKKIELQFENKEGSYKLSKVTKEGFDVKKAKGAPVIIHVYTHRFMGAKRYDRKIVGVLSIDSNGELYPVLFKHGFLDERPSRSDTAVPGTSRQSDERPSRSDTAVPGTSRQSEEDASTERPRTGSGNKERDYSEDSEKLKEAIKGNTEKQPKFIAGHDVTSARTDDIFTNLTVYYADKKQVKTGQAEGLTRRERLQGYTKRKKGVKVKKCEDIFVDTEGKIPKRLLLTGKPGIGKTLFCEKFIRDWSMNRLFQNKDTPNIKFAYLLKFRHLSRFGEKEMNLQELLNCSPLLDNNSKIDDSIFEYLTKNPSEVLIILDGFDEYSQQNRDAFASDVCELENDYTKKMPIPALCSQLIKGKFLRNSVVLVSSRPNEAENLGKISFDRYVEISGFSPEQVTEYVERYFSEPEKEQTRNTVSEHVEKNENLVSLCHIPLLSFLLCWCLDWRITQSGTTENLPAKITDLYDEVANVVVQKLHTDLKNEEMSESDGLKIAQDTLRKLAELAANLLKESKYIFDEEDMKKQNLTEDEIENLKVSGILHCIPGIRISAFQTKSEFSFIHLTFQEYLAAVFFVKFVKDKEIPEKDKVTGQTFVFMSGLLSSRGEDGKKLMTQLNHEIKIHFEFFGVKLLMLQCLYEYGDENLTKQTINNLYYEYCNRYGLIEFSSVTDVDVKYISYLLGIICLLKDHQPQSFTIYTLDIAASSLTSFGVGILCKSLVLNSFITRLRLHHCSLDDNCVKIITDSLVSTGLTNLDLSNSNMTDKGVESICSVLTKTKITHLNLEGNNITDKGVESICSVLKESKITNLNLGRNKITREGEDIICEVIEQDGCPVDWSELWDSQYN